MSDSQPASLTSIGRSTNAAITAMTVRRRGTPRPEGANCLPDVGNPAFPRMIFRSRFMAHKATLTGILNQELLKIVNSIGRAG
jgi:hypothetical protein